MWWKWTKRIVLGLLATLALLAIGGVLYQTISTKIDAHAYPPPGTLVDIGGYRLHLNCQGQGSPTVILDTGLGSPSLEWALVQSEVAKWTRVCSYDRAGLGWSDESPRPRTSQDMVEELHTLLHKANISGPYILVGHSLGGINMRLFVSQYPEEVKGVVLVDSAHEDQFEKIPMPEMNKEAALFFSYLGINRLITHSSMFKNALKMYPEDIQEQYLALTRTNKFYRSVFSEMAGLKESAKQLKQAGGLLGDRPLIVISAGRSGDPEGTGYTQEQIEEIKEHFKLFQKDLVTKSSHSKQVIAEQSDHMITRHQPSIIIEAIKEEVNEIRAKDEES